MYRPTIRLLSGGCPASVADNPHCSGPTRGVFGGGQKKDSGILSGFNLCLAVNNPRRKAFDGKGYFAVEIVPAQRQDLDRNRFAAAQKGGPEVRFPRIFFDWGWGWRNCQKPKIRLLPTQRKTINVARIAVVEVEQI